MITDIRPTYTILQGDIRDLISQIGEVDCVVTSPPYWHQRQYGTTPELEVGQEGDTDTYIDGLVEVFKGIKLHPLGSIWVNISDKRHRGSLLNISARFSQAMINADFRLIDEVVWAKSRVFDNGTTSGHCMTEPCRTRLNGNGHEMLFRFTKSDSAWADTLAVQIPRENVPTVRYLPSDLMSVTTALNGRNLHNVWDVGMGQTTEKHFAVYPPSLCERPIALTCPLFVEPDGALPSRIAEWIEYDEKRGKRIIGKDDPASTTAKKGRHDVGRRYIPRMPISLGWEPVSDNASPGVVLDPFMGTGTTGEVALKMGRSFVGVDLYSENTKIAERRCADAVRYVDTNYGYDRVYEMIMRDQHDLKAKLEGERLDRASGQERGSVFDHDELFTFA